MTIKILKEDVRGEDYFSDSSLTLIITFSPQEEEKAQEVAEMFVDLDVWFRSDIGDDNDSIIVLWQGNDKSDIEVETTSLTQN